MGAISKLFLAASAIGGVSAFSSVPEGSASGRSASGSDILPTETYNNIMEANKVGWQKCLYPKYTGQMKTDCFTQELAEYPTGSCSAILAAKPGGGRRIGKDLGLGACNKYGEDECNSLWARFAEGSAYWEDGVYDAVYDCAWDASAGKCKKAKEYQGCFRSAQIYAADETDAIEFDEMNLSPYQIDAPEVDYVPVYTP